MINDNEMCPFYLLHRKEELPRNGENYCAVSRSIKADTCVGSMRS